MECHQPDTAILELREAVAANTALTLSGQLDCEHLTEMTIAHDWPNLPWACLKAKPNRQWSWSRVQVLVHFDHHVLA